MAPLTAGSRAGHAHEFVRMETFTEGSDASQRGSGNDLRLLQSQSENVGGLRGTISNKLGAALSYSPGASVRDAAAAQAQGQAACTQAAPISMFVCVRCVSCMGVVLTAGGRSGPDDCAVLCHAAQVNGDVSQSRDTGVRPGGQKND